MTPFPITGSVINADVSVDPGVQGSVRVIDGSADWNQPDKFPSHESNLFPPQQRTVALKQCTGLVGAVFSVLVSRQWNGIGGIAFVPSFPQLNRRETTFPDAV